jgi:hypothetical protein
VNECRYLVLALRVLADWLDGELAAGLPPKWLVGQAVAGIREIASEARQIEEATP